MKRAREERADPLVGYEISLVWGGREVHASGNCRKEKGSGSEEATCGKAVLMAALSFVFPVLRCDKQAGKGSP